MRIGVFDPYLDTLGGGEKYMLTAACYLSQKHEVTVFWDQNGVLEKGAARFNLDLSKVKTANNIFSAKTPLYKRYLESKKYDAIFFLSDGSLPLLGSKLYIHFQFPIEWVNKSSLLSKLKELRIAKIICNSYFTKAFIDKKFNTDSEILYPPTYLKKDFPKVNPKKKKNQILNVGRLSAFPDGGLSKKQDFIIKVFKEIVDSGVKNWELVLVVSFLEKDQEILEALKKQIKGYPIKIFANVALEKLNEVYAQSKIYWHASGFAENLTIHPERAEHFGITTVEAMLNGLVPVVINAGGQKEIVRDGRDGFLFDNVKEMIDKTMQLIKDNVMLEKMAKSAREKAGEFSTDRFCEKLDSIFTR
ncbi:MAG TPA: glycosyltransferase family 4 protein [Patescibacteria group bacterium]|jgi:glycosyltransferase involved in cell wall biosynthesis|nr:glycosyltransferase family 4 protein [Patescibacteria group bacterium]